MNPHLPILLLGTALSVTPAAYSATLSASVLPSPAPAVKGTLAAALTKTKAHTGNSKKKGKSADAKKNNKASANLPEPAANNKEFSHEEALQALKERGLQPNSEWLYQAANQGDLCYVNLHLAAGAAAETVDHALVTACWNPSTSGTVIVKRLLKAGADPNRTDSSGQTALMFACGCHPFSYYCANAESVRLLLEAGAKVNAADNENRTALHFQTATEQDDGDKELRVQQLLKAGANVNAADKEGNTPFLNAAATGKAPIAKLLLDAGADIHARNKAGKTALAAAAEKGHILLVRHLLALGDFTKKEITEAQQVATANNQAACAEALQNASPEKKEKQHSKKAAAKKQAAGDQLSAEAAVEELVNRWYLSSPEDIKNDIGKQAMHAATNDIEVMRLLLAAGAAAEGRFLLDASDSGNYDCLQALIAAGANVNAGDGFGSAPLHLVWGGHTLALKALLAAGANASAIGYHGDTALRAAADYGYVNCVKALLAAGADVNHVDEVRRTALSEACLYGHISCIKALLKASPDQNCLNLSLQNACLIEREPALKYKGHKTMAHMQEIIRMLLQAGAEINAADDRGYTPLMLMSMSKREGSEVGTRLLLEEGADIRAASSEGYTALMSACNGIDEEIGKKHEHLGGSSAHLKLLLDAGADVNAKNKAGKTALMYAAAKNPYYSQDTYEEEQVLRIRLLLDAGADVNAKDNAGKTALSYASSEPVRELLKKAGAKE